MGVLKKGIYCIVFCAVVRLFGIVGVGVMFGAMSLWNKYQESKQCSIN